ncbi:unnamed protein product [Adineta ricciae]|uniref:Uncharacterized protein n=1 Tax=Adineta ricciae TaxID=249248 RepID=A0A815IL05_ADIRI|nr:unnamed protein product [Adineta ricciae]CAF1366915.1 unnamed protein product [Adineta ricciae]
MDTDTQILSHQLWDVFYKIFLVFSLIAGIIVGSYGLSLYLKAKQDEHLFRPWQTICTLLDYEAVKHDCKSCGEDGCIVYTCYNQVYQIIYEIFNGTFVNSTIVFNDKQTQRIMKVGENYTCYYDEPHDVTFVKWEYEDQRTGLILLCVGYGIVGIDLFLIMVSITYQLLRKCWTKPTILLSKISFVRRRSDQNPIFIEF